MMANHYFYYSLILIAILREGDRNRQRKDRSVIRRNLKMLEKWAQLCPENFRHMHDLVAAELAGLDGRFRSRGTLPHRY